jgi:hypothetical protein
MHICLLRPTAISHQPTTPIGDVHATNHGGVFTISTLIDSDTVRYCDGAGGTAGSVRNEEGAAAAEDQAIVEINQTKVG